MGRESVLLRIMGFVETMLGQTNGQRLLVKNFESNGGEVTPSNLRQLEIIYKAGSATDSDVNTALGRMSDDKFLKKKINSNG